MVSVRIEAIIKKAQSNRVNSYFALGIKQEQSAIHNLLDWGLAGLLGVLDADMIVCTVACWSHMRTMSEPWVAH
jgi:hypothetical protein